jgi:hypothetical protein
MFKGLCPIDGDRLASCPEGVDHRIAGAARLRRFHAIAAILLRAQERSMARRQTRLAAEIFRNGKQHGFIRLPYSVHRSAYGWIPIPVAE